MADNEDWFLREDLGLTSAPEEEQAMESSDDWFLQPDLGLGATQDSANAANTTVPSDDADLRQIERDRVGNPFRTGLGELSESFLSSAVRPVLAAPMAAINTADRYLTGQQNPEGGTFGEEYAQASRSLGYGASGDESEDTPMERVARVGFETLGMGIDAIVLGGLPAANNVRNKVTSTAYQLYRRMSQPTGNVSRVGEVRDAVKGVGQEMMQGFLNNPARFSAVEMVTNAGAASGAAAAEIIAPGNPTTRYFGEILGGVASPIAATTRLASRASGQTEDATGIFNGVFQSFSEAKAEANVARRIQRALELSGEDGEQLVRQLAEFNAATAAGETPPLPAGTATGNQALTALEKMAAQRNAAVGGQRQELIENAFRQYNRTVDSLIATGDPENIRAAARLAQAHEEDLLETSINQAQQRVYETLSRFDGVDPRAASREAYEILSDSLRNARATEDKLWQLVPKDEPADTSALREVFDDVRQGLLPSQRAPFESDIQTFISGDATTGDLITLRSNLMNEARMLRRNGDAQSAARAERLAVAARKALESTSALSANPAYVKATSFSRAINSRFTDTFAGNIDPRGRSGDLILPEQLLDRAFGPARSRTATGRQDAANNLRAIQEASAETSPTRVISEESSDATNWNEWFDTSVLAPQANSAQEQFLRGVVQRDFMDEVDGEMVVNARQLGRFLSDNPDVVEQFPVLAGDLRDAISAQNVLKHAQREQVQTARQLKEQAFSKLLGDTPAETVVYDITFGRNNAGARDNLRNLVQIANRSENPEDAMAGLRSASLSALFRKAGSREGDSFFTNLDQALNSPLTEGGTSAKNLFRELGIMTDSELVRLDRVISAASSVEGRNAALQTLDVSEAEGVRGALTDLALRVQGAYVGGKLGSLTGRPGGLVEAEAGSRFMRHLFRSMPGSHAQEILERAVLNPQMMQRILELKTAPTMSNRDLSRQLDAFMLSAGYEYALDEDAEEIPRAFEYNPENYIPD